MEPRRVRLDLNDSEFQADLFGLTKQQQISLLGTLRKLSRMTWDQVYRDPGLRWEAIASPEEEQLYSFRIGKSFRAVAFREGDWLRIVSLHPDHDSAYQ